MIGANRICKSKGYTALEMALTLTMFSVLTIIAGGVFDSSQESLNWNYHQLTLQKELRRTLAVMVQEIRESSPSSPTPITTGANTITFETPLAISGNFITAWTRVTYSLGADTTVLRTINGQNPAKIGSSINSINFVYPLNAVTAPRTVQIRITGQRTTLKRIVTAEVTGQVILRN